MDDFLLDLEPVSALSDNGLSLIVPVIVETGYVTLLLPISFFLIKEYGVIGGGISWLILNLAYLLIEIPIMHTKILKKEMKEWYLQDFLKPLMHALLPLIGLRLVLPDNLNRFELVLIFIMVEIIIVLFMIKKIPKLKRLLNY